MVDVERMQKAPVQRQTKCPNKWGWLIVALLFQASSVVVSQIVVMYDGGLPEQSGYFLEITYRVAFVAMVYCYPLYFAIAYAVFEEPLKNCSTTFRRILAYSNLAFASWHLWVLLPLVQ